MKTIKLIKGLTFAFLIISSFNSYSQKSGVYKTYSDFIAGKMEYAIDCATEKHKIKLNDFLKKDYITVIHDGKPYNLKKVETWGYQLCDEKIVRFQVKDHFPLEDKGILWIYSKQYNTSCGPKSNSPHTVTTYYFSKGGDGVIKELTLLNLKAAFPDNHALHDAIDVQFKSDASLIEYDQFHKHYKINHFMDSQGIK